LKKDLGKEAIVAFVTRFMPEDLQSKLTAAKSKLKITYSDNYVDLCWIEYDEGDMKERAATLKV
jgi:hypothetical protein